VTTPGLAGAPRRSRGLELFIRKGDPKAAPNSCPPRQLQRADDSVNRGTHGIKLRIAPSVESAKVARYLSDVSCGQSIQDGCHWACYGAGATFACGHELSADQTALGSLVAVGPFSPCSFGAMPRMV
jgi:hypothetical protein